MREPFCTSHARRRRMNPVAGLPDPILRMIEAAMRLFQTVNADVLLLLPEGPLAWEAVREAVGEVRVIVAGDKPEMVDPAKALGFPAVMLDDRDAPVIEQLTQALLEFVADDVLKPGARVVALYSGFEPGEIDSISVINLGEHLERLTAHDLRQLETSVPLDTLKQVVDLAVEIGREGREGKPVGTMFVIGDVRKVTAHSREGGFDPVKGYGRKARNLSDRRTREGIKEVAQLDGAFIIASDGTVEAACRIIDAPAKSITLSKGLGSRHWAAAAITKVTKAVAVAISESSGTVRIFQNGEVVLRIEPFRRAMKWKEFEYEPPVSKEEPRSKEKE